MKKLARFGETSAWKNEGREEQRTRSQINRALEIPVDRLNDLPDSLLIHILSLLQVKDAAITSVLSKRWCSLWLDRLNAPDLEFWEFENENVNHYKTHLFVAWVNKLLALRTLRSVGAFSVRIRNDHSYESEIGKWIGYAANHGVEKLSLEIHYEYYALPESIYSCISLKFLSLRGQIDIASKGKIDWKCLRELHFGGLELGQELVDEILLSGGCPVLHRLEIKRCWGYYQLKTHSPNHHLRILVVEDSEDLVEDPVIEVENIVGLVEDPEVEVVGLEDEDEDQWTPRLRIIVPSLDFLDLTLYPDGRLSELDIKFNYKARINFMLHGLFPQGLEHEVVVNYTKELLHNIQHVEELQLNPNCFEAISTLAVAGWQHPQSKRRHLEVSSSIAYMHNISGIMALLESSPNLETLVLQGFDTDKNHAFPNQAAVGDLDWNLSRLKIVYFRNFADRNGEPLLTLARMLHKRAPALENIKVMIDGVERKDFIKID